MVPKLFRSGKSFKKLALYLLHDAGKAETSGRLRWTHTINLASDDPRLGVDEMLWTYRGADWLKQQAGVGSGGRPLKHPVRHFSLNWHPSESPSRAQMIEAVERFMEHMGWQGHQAILFNHIDKQHPHVHVMLNAVHPETGRALDAGFERRRAQVWAEAYEREHGLIFCEERLKPVEERQASPTREAWQRMKAGDREIARAEFERVAKDFDYFTRHDPAERQTREWRLLKDQQRSEREAFFMEGKEAYRGVRNQVFREVRTEFKAFWRAYYEGLKKDDPIALLAQFKEAIIAGQKAELDERRKAACDDLRKTRDLKYAALLARQTEERADLKHRQERGLSSPQLLDRRYPPGKARADMSEETRASRRDRAAGDFRRASREVGSKGAPSKTRRDDSAREGFQPRVRPAAVKVHDGFSALGGLGLGGLGAIAEIGERLFDGFFGRSESENDMAVEREAKPDPEREAAQLAGERQARIVTQTQEAAALKAYWEERRQRRRERD
ncbi:relaxase/mobilization nuclease domain-containing protein [Bradyrhizobium sp.]